MTKVKICGLKRKEDIEFANILLPEYAGFVFAASPRQVSAEQAAKLRAELDLRVRTVGVFVKEDINFIKRLAAERIIDVVQLHGDESQEYCRELRRKINLPVIKVLRVRNIESFESTIDYECDYLLLDTYTKTAYGGSGQRFDLVQPSVLPLLSLRFTPSHSNAFSARSAYHAALLPPRNSALLPLSSSAFPAS